MCGAWPTAARAAALAVALAALAAPSTHAATFEVTKRGDPAPGACLRHDCSLREAVLAANGTLGDADRILLPARKRYNLRIANALPEEDGSLTGDLDVSNDPLHILHRGRGRATIDANGTDRVLEIFAGAPTTLEKLVLTGGADPSGGGYGGGVRAREDVTTLRTAVKDNAATACGGGIHSEMGVELELARSRVAGNRATGDGGGVSHSCFGGAGALTVRKTTISGNRSDSDGDGIGRGGAMYVQTATGTTSTISRSAVSGNAAGGAAATAASLEGGGIYTDLGKLIIRGATVSNNRAVRGGGISVDGSEPLTMVNSTVAGNRSSSNGGGIHGDSGEIELNAVTVVRNRGNADGVLSEAGGGLYNDDIPFRVENSLIALNTLKALIPGDPPVRNDCSGASGFDSAGHNLLSSAFLCDGFEAAGDRVRRNPRIGMLADNGGPTRTVALKGTSPAIDRARPGSSPSRDQRGVKRRDPDIGAYERR